MQSSRPVGHVKQFWQDASAPESTELSFRSLANSSWNCFVPHGGAQVFPEFLPSAVFFLLFCSECNWTEGVKNSLSITSSLFCSENMDVNGFPQDKY